MSRKSLFNIEKKMSKTYGGVGTLGLRMAALHEQSDRKEKEMIIIQCPNCQFNGLKYLQENPNKRLHGTDKGKWKRDNFTAKCKECGWGGDVRSSSETAFKTCSALKRAEVNPFE